LPSEYSHLPKKFLRIGQTFSTNFVSALKIEIRNDPWWETEPIYHLMTGE
jgi:hypothetical protein